MNTFSTQALTVLLASVAVVASASLTAGLTGCGAVKSGFNTDPLAGNARYKAMQKEGVPQPGDKVGLPNPIPVVDHLGNPVPGELPPNQEQAPVGQVPASIPADEVGQVPTAVTTNKITLQAAPMPETQVLNFFEGQAAVYQITVVDSKGAATAANLPKGATFKKVSEDVYEMKWIPAKGTADATMGSSLSTLKISVGPKRLHNVIVAVMAEDGTPLVEKISLSFGSVNAGDSVGLQVVAKDGGPKDQEFAIALIEDSGRESEEIKKMYASAKVSNITPIENGRIRADVVLDTKGVKLGEKTELRFSVGAARGEVLSVTIPQIIKLNQESKTAAKASQKAPVKKATGAKK